MALVEVEESYLERLQWKVKNQYSIIRNLQEELERETKAKDRSDFIIRTELEPRIEREKQSYDAWVTSNTGEQEAEDFYSTVDKLCDKVDKGHEACFEWEETEGDLYAMILYLIKNREDVEDGYYYIGEHWEK